MYGINLQLFNSKLRISIFDNLPKKLNFAENLQFAQLKFPVKISPKPRKTHCVSCAKNSAKVRKKKFARKYFCAKDLAISWKPYLNWFLY